MKKISLIFLFVALSILSATAQMLEPVKWKSSAKMDNDSTGTIEIIATIEDGWHLYAMDIPEGGPKPTQITFETLENVELLGEITPSTPAHEFIDNTVFHMKLGQWDNSVKFLQKFKLKDTNKDGYVITGNISFQACNDQTCTAPTKKKISLKKGNLESKKESVSALKSTSSALSTQDTWKPIETTDETQDVSDSSLWYIFILGFVGGFVALLTPCVWPMIPMTVSFFLKQNGSRAKSIRDAMIYGFSIIVIYLILGIAITIIFGPSMLNDLATNAIFNLIFFALLLVFAISFFGAFDIKLPSKWSNSVDNKAETTTGLLSIFFMAFTLALVSFSCTGPIIGTLLVEAATSGDLTGPIIGMAGFALALAIPFSLFAIFPSWLKEMPHSGGWLNSVKVVLGFLELALALKFLSVADLAYGWGILDREVFVSLWIVIFALLGMYLLGKLRFPHDTPTESVSIFRFFLALISFSFAMYLIPGLWGAPLKSVSAFVPPLYTQDFNLYEGGKFQEFDDYDEGMAYAKENGKPVLIDFSGYGCVNCRKMEGAVFDTPEVENIIKNDFVLIKLMVDDKKSLPQPMIVTENGEEVSLETVGEKWSYLQRHKFKANSQPYYIVLDNSGNALTQPTYYDENVDKFIDWLNDGSEKYKK